MSQQHEDKYIFQQVPLFYHSHPFWTLHLSTFPLSVSLFISLNLNAFMQSSDVKQAHRFAVLQELSLSWVKANLTLLHAVDHTPSYFLGNRDSFP